MSFFCPYSSGLFTLFQNCHSQVLKTFQTLYPRYPRVHTLLVTFSCIAHPTSEISYQRVHSLVKVSHKSIFVLRLTSINTCTYRISKTPKQSVFSFSQVPVFAYNVQTIVPQNFHIEKQRYSLCSTIFTDKIKNRTSFFKI